MSLPGNPDHVADPVGPRRLWTVPNGLTGLRLALVPLLAWLMVRAAAGDTEARWWAMGVFALAAVTDFADGAIARASGAVTTIGKIADPIADKAIIGVALIGLSWWGDLAWWITAVILVREALVTALRFAVLSHGIIPATRGGKAKTVAQIIAISVYLAPLDATWDPLRFAAMGVAVVLTVVTGIDYVVRAWALRRGSSARRSPS